MYFTILSKVNKQWISLVFWEELQRWQCLLSGLSGREHYLQRWGFPFYVHHLSNKRKYDGPDIWQFAINWVIILGIAVSLLLQPVLLYSVGKLGIKLKYFLSWQEVWGNMPMARERPASSGSISSLLPASAACTGREASSHGDTQSTWWT